jgi:hypothetical protein
VNARDELLAMMDADRFNLLERNDAIDAYAHKLAEAIRNHPWEEGCASGCCDDDRGAQKAADLIDPGA